MKAKRVRRQFRRVFRNNVRLIWSQLVRLTFRERARMAWLMLRGSEDLDWAAKKGDAK